MGNTGTAQTPSPHNIAFCTSGHAFWVGVGARARDDAGYIETLLVVPLCSVTILEEDRDMRCRSPAHLGVVVDGHVRVVWLPKIVSEIGLKSIQELGYTVESVGLALGGCPALGCRLLWSSGRRLDLRPVQARMSAQDPKPPQLLQPHLISWPPAQHWLEGWIRQDQFIETYQRRRP